MFYRITVTLKDFTVHKGIREHRTTDINEAWLIFQAEAHKAYPGRIEDFSCEGLSDYSPEACQILLASGRKPPGVTNEERIFKPQKELPRMSKTPFMRRDGPPKLGGPPDDAHRKGKYRT